ncbi:MAG: Rrf2 family transcriptional regulator [Kiritimatiellaeota bacterium]|nr:Rrf2 family transcriptional regulator [Kiritimatiellota bacterium]
MILLSKRAEYGLMALLHLTGAAVRRQPVSAASIAARHHIPAALLGKVMQDLARHGLVESVAGVAGGYRLRHAPAQVTLGAVVAAMDGPIQLAACQSGGACDQRKVCNVRAPLLRLNDAVVAPFERITLADMKGRAHGGSKPKPRR